MLPVRTLIAWRINDVTWQWGNRHKTEPGTVPERGKEEERQKEQSEWWRGSERGTALRFAATYSAQRKGRTWDGEDRFDRAAFTVGLIVAFLSGKWTGRKSALYRVCACACLRVFCTRTCTRAHTDMHLNARTTVRDYRQMVSLEWLKRADEQKQLDWRAAIFHQFVYRVVIFSVIYLTLFFFLLLVEPLVFVSRASESRRWAHKSGTQENLKAQKQREQRLCNSSHWRLTSSCYFCRATCPVSWRHAGLL